MSSDIIRMVVDDLNTVVVIFSEIPLPENKPEITFSNAALCKVTGYTETEFGEKLLQGLFCSQSNARVTLSIEHKLREGLPVRESELLLKNKEGIYFWASVSIMSPDGYDNAWVLVMQDITQQKMAEERLEHDNQQLAVTLRSIGDGVITVDTKGKIEFINYQGEDITGYRQKDASGKLLGQIFYIVDEKTKEPLPNPLTKVFKSARPFELGKGVLLIQSNGDERRIRCNVAPIMDQSKCVTGAVLAFSDISEKSKLEEELNKSQRMESIALLASGVAHDFNNILTGILGNISLATNHCKEDNPLYHFLTAAEKASMRAKDLTYQLLTFAKGGVTTKSKASISQLLSEAAGFILSGSKCRLEKSFPETLWPVEVDEGQILQVVNNLFINAVQAMPEGGTITIAAENIDAGGEPSLPLAPGAFSKISISDQGVGIPLDKLTRIFDPYFTTKKSGTGLGLATTYSIVKNHGGHIEVDSEEGVGTTFTLYLPALPGQVDSQPETEVEVYRGKGRILIMDDEQMVQQIVGDMLVHLGYEVGFSENGKDAIEKYEIARNSGNPFDLLILDMTVPGGLGAQEVLTDLIAKDENVKAILSSGYIDSPLMRSYREHGFRGTITKPFNIQEISWVVKSVIEEGKEAL